LPDAPLAGVPFLLKDLFAALAGEPLTYSSRLLVDYVPSQDSELVARYRRAGLIIVGKTNTPEFGLMPVTESELRGPARNPWDLSLTPGGSSGGSAAAVASGMVPVAHGSDSGGSLRIPASCCGLFGLKPSRGRNPCGPEQGQPLAGLFQEHVISRSVRDSAAVLDATQGPDLGARLLAPPSLGPYLDECRREPPALRIAVCRGALLGGRLHADCEAAVADAAHLCADLGHLVEEARPDISKEAAAGAFLTISMVELAHGLRMAERARGHAARRGELENRTRFLRAIGERISAEQYVEATNEIYRVGRIMEDFLQRYDLLLTSTLTLPPVPIGHFKPSGHEKRLLSLLEILPLGSMLQNAILTLSESVIAFIGNTLLFNMSGQPAASIPLFWNAAGIPIGIQLGARFGQDAMLFRIGGQLERARPWFNRRPPVPSAA
jgi:amidase